MSTKAIATRDEELEDVKLLLAKCVRRRDILAVQVRELMDKLAATEAAFDALVKLTEAKQDTQYAKRTGVCT